MRRFAPLALLAALAVPACSGAEAAKPSTISITGSITVPGGLTEGGLEGGAGQVCVMDGGYSDVREGAQVVVSDDKSTTIAIGRLGGGRLVLPDPDYWSTRKCVFPFTVSAPAGHPFYGVEVSHRGRLQYTAAQLAVPLALTLGD